MPRSMTRTTTPSPNFGCRTSSPCAEGERDAVGLERVRRLAGDRVLPLRDLLALGRSRAGGGLLARRCAAGPARGRARRRASPSRVRGVALGLRAAVEVVRVARLALDLLHHVADHGDDAVGQVELAFGAVGVDLAARLRLLLRRRCLVVPRALRPCPCVLSFILTSATTSGFGNLLSPPLWLGPRLFVVLLARARRRVVRDEANLGLDLEGELGQHLGELVGELRLLEDVAHLLGDDAVEAVLGLVDLLVEVVEHLLRQLHLRHEVPEVLGSLGEAVRAGLDRALDHPLQNLRHRALEEALLLLLARSASG